MRVLHVLAHVREVGNGIVNSTIDLAALLAARHDVAVASAGGDFVPLLEACGVRHFELPQRRTPLGILRAAASLRRIVDAFEPDIVHAQMMTGAVLARCVRVGSRYGLVTTVHNEFERSAIAMGVGDIVTANSVAVARSMERRGVPQRKLRVVAIGALDGPRRRRSGASEPLELERPAVVTVAGLYFRKGIDVLIDAFAKVPTDAHLYIVGSGPDGDAFEARAKASDAARRIHFTGFDARPERYMRGADIFVLASRKEPFGMVLSEAREAGCAIVASEVGGIPEALDGGAAGRLVPAGDPVALRAALAELLGSSEVLEDWRGRARHGLTNFTAQRYCDEMESVYRELLSRRREPRGAKR